MQNQLHEDGTVNFLPNRLNRQPIIVRGLTADELWITVAITGGGGLVLGIMVAFFTGQIGMAPTTVLACITAGVFIGGSILRRKKRGRPETWLYRQIQWQLHCRFPVLDRIVGGTSLIGRSGSWEIRRSLNFSSSKKEPKRRPNDPGKNRSKDRK